jgi:hypothetical protein
MNPNDIIIIDDNKYYYDYDIDSLIPIDLNDPYNNINKNSQNQSNKPNNTDTLTNMDSNEKNKISDDTTNLNEWYMENYDIDFWESILSRQLDRTERKIIHGVWNENSLNIDIEVLQKNLIKYGCYIKSITNNIGNCLFESLASLGLGDNDLNINPHDMIRKSIASVLLMVKTEISFFPNTNLTPEEVFSNINEIEFVKDKKTNQVYVYDYDLMLYDLNSNFSWERLPTEFILMAISRIYEVEIRIYHNKTDFVNKINVCPDLQKDLTEDNIIRLGQINEEHYFPLEELPDDLKTDSNVINEITNTNISYTQSINKFKKWSKLMMDSIGLNNDFTKNQTKSDDVIENNEKEKDERETKETKEIKVLKSNNKLTIEQIEDYNEISNFSDFDIL